MKQSRNDMPRRGGHGARQGQRKGGGPSVAPNLIGLLPSIGTGDGLLPLPGTPNVGFITQLRAATMLNMAHIQKNLNATVEMLTNPPPVPGEIVTEFKESARKNPVPVKREHSGPPGGKSVRPLMDFPTSKGAMSLIKPPQQKQQRSENVPNWLQKTFEGACQIIEQGKEGQFVQGNSGAVVSTAERTQADETNALSPRKQNTILQRAILQNDINSREVRLSPTLDSGCDTQALASKRKSPFYNAEAMPGGKVVVGTSPGGLPQPNTVRVKKTYKKAVCPQQLKSGSCVNKRCQYWHLPKAELEEVNAECFSFFFFYIYAYLGLQLMLLFLPLFCSTRDLNNHTKAGKWLNENK